MSDIESSDTKDFNSKSEVDDSASKMSLSVTTTTTSNNNDELGKFLYKSDPFDSKLFRSMKNCFASSHMEKSIRSFYNKQRIECSEQHLYDFWKSA